MILNKIHNELYRKISSQFRYLIFSVLTLFAVNSVALAEAAHESVKAQLAVKKDLPVRFHSYAGREHEITFEAVYVMSTERANRLLNIADLELRNEQFMREVKPALPYLMGPGTHRNLGGPKKLINIVADWASVKIEDDNSIVPYTYTATWILNKKVAVSGEFELPVPYNENVLFTADWKKCGDTAPDHQTRSFFWYFWDPTRYGCEHKEGVEYQNAKVRVGLETFNQTETYPEYERLVREIDGKNVMTMTFAFGYANESHNPNPATDYDVGVVQYRQFLAYLQATLADFSAREIAQGEYKGGYEPELVIGREFTGQRGDIHYTVRVVVNAGIDQMNLFAKSFAQDHDGFFAWFGHSRVGSGFDAEQFARMLRADSERFSISDKYQIIYWGGCNSYTYYTLPFFKFKADLGLTADPNGTKNLDIISNGMPSYFHLNSPNAIVSFNALMKYPVEKVSYQNMIKEIEEMSWREAIMTNVLGDEDNANAPGDSAADSTHNMGTN